AEQALARGWDEKVDGPAPDVWSPASSAWVVLLRQRLRGDAAPLVPDTISHVAFSPLVIAMPKPMAVALGWPSKQLGWSDLLTLARDPAGRARVGHPEWKSKQPRQASRAACPAGRDLPHGGDAGRRPSVCSAQCAMGRPATSPGGSTVPRLRPVIGSAAAVPQRRLSGLSGKARSRA